MSFKKKVQDEIMKYVLTKVEESEMHIISKTREAYGISDTTVRRYLQKLIDLGLIVKNGTKYSLKTIVTTYDVELSATIHVEEDDVYSSYVSPSLSGLPDNVISIWKYCFTEMMNNVIEHANASKATIRIERNAIYTEIILHDNGIGIFRKIKSCFSHLSVDDVIIELFKGKLTTDKSAHTGEGIFFSSIALDFFAVVSGKKVFSRNEFNADTLFEIASGFAIEGTTVFMRLANDSKKALVEAFNQFASVDGGYTRTLIPIRSVFNHFPVSRSEAKRLSARLDQFEEVVIDFLGVETIGQGFADELFVRYQTMHPSVKILIRNANTSIDQMYYHVTGRHIRSSFSPQGDEYDEYNNKVEK